MKRGTVIVLMLLLMTVALVAVTGCGDEEPVVEDELVPRLEPPVIGEAGVLRVGIDLAYPPFGGIDKEHEAGIDIDVAQAMAADMGLELRVVDMPLSEVQAALDSGEIDVAFAIPFDESYATALRFAGSYVSNGPAVFATADAVPASADELQVGRVAVQQGSAAFWILDHAYGSDFAVNFSTLREAFEALVSGEVDAVACDAFVGAYMARDLEGIEYAFQLDAAAPVGTAVGPEADELESEVRAVLDVLQADGVLETIRSKWVGGLPKLELPDASGM